jgi:hypothetical protein
MMIRRLSRTLLVLAAVLLLGAAIGFGLLNTSLGTSLVEQRLRAWIHPNLQLNGPMRVSVVPRLGLDLEDVTFVSSQAAQPLASVERLQVQLSWRPLMGRQLHIQTLYAHGVRLYQPGSHEQSQTPELEELFTASRLAIMPSAPEKPWQIRVEQALFEDVALLVVQETGPAQPLVLAQQIQLQYDGAWSERASGQLGLGLRQLLITDVHRLGQVNALLEQLGMVNGDSWDVSTIDSSWQINDGVAQLISGSTYGSWGSIESDAATIDLQSGALAIDVVAKLVNSPRMRSRGIEIQVRRSELRFTLTGRLNDIGVTWLN